MNEFRFICGRLRLDEHVLKILSVTERHTGWEVRIVKNCDRGLENAARGRRPREAFSSLRSQFFSIRTDHNKPANNLFIFFLR